MNWAADLCFFGSGVLIGLWVSASVRERGRRRQTRDADRDAG